MSTLPAINTFTLPESVSDLARVWVHQSTRILSTEEVSAISAECQTFAAAWAAHGTQLKADYGIYFNRFICLFVDETAHGASGCSIDSSVHFIQSLERKYKLELFTRTEVAFFNDGEEIDTTHMNDLGRAATMGRINKDTRVFNNLIATKGEMESNWIVPISESWHARLLD